MNEPTISPVSYDHPHTMEKAITTLSQLGFILCNLDNEFMARYTDELLLADKDAKAIGSFTLTTRAKMSPIIGSENNNFSKYSMVSHIGLLTYGTIQEAIRSMPIVALDNSAFKNIIIKPSIHKN
jgi:hypothetical protein